jgi:hypothetical protein
MTNKFSQIIENENPKRKIKNVYNFLFSIIVRPCWNSKFIYQYVDSSYERIVFFVIIIYYI